MGMSKSKRILNYLVCVWCNREYSYWNRMKMGNKKSRYHKDIDSSTRASLSEYPRPASGARVSTLDTQLHSSGNFSVSKENGGVKKVSDIPII